MRTEWRGYYLDGKTAARHPAVIVFQENGLLVTPSSGTTVTWPYPDIRQTQGFYDGEQIRLEKGQNPGEALLIDNPEFLAELHRFAPKKTVHFHNPAHRKMRTGLITAATLGTVLAVAVLYFWGIPSFSSLVSTRVPVSWEEQYGQAMTEQLAPPENFCDDYFKTRQIESIIQTLTRTLPSNPYTFKIRVIKNPTINAFAVPGGYILLLSGLLEKTGSPEELAGVLAHEAQHVLLRHATRELLQQASTGLLLSALTGNANGAMTYGLEGARTIGMLRYSRQYEEEADSRGMEMVLAAGINPKGMIKFFEMLEKEERVSSAIPKYLSTHPATEDRISKLKIQAKKAGNNPVKLLPDTKWEEIKNICKTSL